MVLCTARYVAHRQGVEPECLRLFCMACARHFPRSCLALLPQCRHALMSLHCLMESYPGPAYAVQLCGHRERQVVKKVGMVSQSDGQQGSASRGTPRRSALRETPLKPVRMMQQCGHGRDCVGGAARGQHAEARGDLRHHRALLAGALQPEALQDLDTFTVFGWLTPSARASHRPRHSAARGLA